MKLILLFLLSFKLYAGNGVVTRIHGKVYIKHKNDQKRILALNDKIKSDALIISSKKSFVKINFEDGTSLALGPDSKMTLGIENPKKPIFINLLKGKLRGSVDKNKKGLDNYNAKMIIKTRSAALGIRGTDFLTTYNENNYITSNLTFKGNVEMYKKSDREIYNSLQEQVDEENNYIGSQSEELELENQNLLRPDIEKIPKGSFSGSYPSYDKAIKAVKISSEQFEILKNNRNANFDKSGKSILSDYSMKEDQLPEGDLLVPNPPGENIKLALKEKDNVIKAADNGGRPGGILDINTGIYVAPPSNSLWDEQSKTYKMPRELGGIDSKSGTYVAPEGTELHATKGFLALNELGKKKLKWLNKIAGKFSKRIKSALEKLKNVSRLDSIWSFNFLYTSNSHELYYSEYRNISNSPSMLFHMDGFLAHLTPYHRSNFSQKL